jgi:hypothetical protein
MEATPIPRNTLIRWPAITEGGVSLGQRVIGCGCVPEGECVREDCPQRPEEQRNVTPRE